MYLNIKWKIDKPTTSSNLLIEEVDAWRTSCYNISPFTNATKSDKLQTRLQSDIKTYQNTKWFQHLGKSCEPLWKCNYKYLKQTHTGSCWEKDWRKDILKCAVEHVGLICIIKSTIISSFVVLKVISHILTLSVEMEFH